MSVRRGVGIAGALVLAVGASGCSREASGAGRDASVEAFCEAYLELYSGDLSDVDGTAPLEAQHDAMVEAYRAWADRLTETGTPADMPASARAGFELMVDAADSLEDADEGNLGLADLADTFTQSELSAVGALQRYTAVACEPPPTPAAHP